MGPYMRDMRDPQELGELLLNRDKRTKINTAADRLDSHERAYQQANRRNDNKEYRKEYERRMRINGDIA